MGISFSVFSNVHIIIVLYINLFLALFSLLVLSMSREHFLREMCSFSATLLVVFVFVFLFLFSFSNFRGRAAVHIHVIFYVTQCDNLLSPPQNKNVHLPGRKFQFAAFSSKGIRHLPHCSDVCTTKRRVSE